MLFLIMSLFYIVFSRKMNKNENNSLKCSF